ncbi:MAG: amino acid dehydrogenase [Proteobacteria bacterium]|nr:amino acid dehydrogenase [Pseudomonadota bacterium]MDA1357428.1 amino acid dehydrogenase [Pseudomonadota bacterium]
MISEKASDAGVVFTSPAFDRHEQVIFCTDAESGLRAIIAIHDTSLGPALGGCRMWPYRTENEAIVDVLRLSRAMSFKNALAKLSTGGGKSVIIGDPERDKSDALFHAFGRFVENLGGRYIVAEDVGTTVEDMNQIRRQTSHVMGFSAREGSSGDPSPVTAYGVFCGLRAAVEFRFGRDDLSGLRVAVQGIGHVGYQLCKYLHEAGAKLLVSDINRAAVARAEADFGARAIDGTDIYSQDVDVFAPCALGAELNSRTIPQLRAQVVAGAANNQLECAEDGSKLAARNILYAPDYVINAGGVINLSYERESRYERDKAMAHTARIYDIAMEIFGRAKREGRPTNEIADNMAQELLGARGQAVDEMT